MRSYETRRDAAIRLLYDAIDELEMEEHEGQRMYRSADSPSMAPEPSAASGGRCLMRDQPCPACHGTGAAQPEPQHHCAACGGTGETTVRTAQMRQTGWDYTGVPCNACHGTGAAAEPKCPRCGAPVVSDYACPKCGYPTSKAAAEPTYPCDKCGKLRTRDQGGTVFTVCDACWAEAHPLPAKAAAEAKGQIRFPRPLPEVERASEVMARRFHELYEGLAESFGYRTRSESRVPWEKVPENNRELMKTVCIHVLAWLDTPEGKRTVEEARPKPASLAEPQPPAERVPTQLETDLRIEIAQLRRDLARAEEHCERAVRNGLDACKERDAARAELAKAEGERNEAILRAEYAAGDRAKANEALATSRALCDELRARIGELEAERDEAFSAGYLDEGKNWKRALDREKQRAGAAEARALANERVAADYRVALERVRGLAEKFLHRGPQRSIERDCGRELLAALDGSGTGRAG